MRRSSAGGHQRAGRERPHAAGVGPPVAVVGPLVVLRHRQADRLAPVADGEERRLHAGQILFDDDAAPGLAEPPVDHRLVHRPLGRGPIRGHRHPLAGREAVRLDDHREPELGPVHRAEGLARTAADPEAGRRHRVPGHELLGERLARFEPRRVPAGPEEAPAARLEQVPHPAGERQLRPDDGEVDRFGLDVREQGRRIRDVERTRRCVPSRPRVAGGADHLSDRRLPPQLPRQRVLARAAPDDQHLHRSRTLPTSRRPPSFDTPPGTSYNARLLRAPRGHRPRSRGPPVARLHATRFRGGRRARSARTGGGTAMRDHARPLDRRRSRVEPPDPRPRRGAPPGRRFRIATLATQGR